MNQLEISLPILAGFFSTALFALGTLPMLVKAFRTKNLASYSLGNILMSNVGNIIYSFYVFHLPLGPVWFLHSFYLLSTGLMLVWYLRYEGLPDRQWSAVNHAVLKQLKNFGRNLKKEVNEVYWTLPFWKLGIPGHLRSMGRDRIGPKTGLPGWIGRRPHPISCMGDTTGLGFCCHDSPGQEVQFSLWKTCY